MATSSVPGWLGVGEAASRLGIDPSAVRALLRSGELPGERFGQQWLVDASVLAQFSDRQRKVGRPFSERIAWSLIAERAGQPAPWSLAREERLRVRRYASRAMTELAPRLRGRARSHRMSVGPMALQRLAEHPRWRRGGIQPRLGADDMPLVVYVASSDLEGLVEDAAAISDAERPNLIVREVADRYWPFTSGQRGEFVWPLVGLLDRYDLGLDAEFASVDPS